MNQTKGDPYSPGMVRRPHYRRLVVATALLGMLAICVAPAWAQWSWCCAAPLKASALVPASCCAMQSGFACDDHVGFSECCADNELGSHDGCRCEWKLAPPNAVVPIAKAHGFKTAVADAYLYSLVADDSDGYAVGWLNFDTGPVSAQVRCAQLCRWLK